MTVTSVHIAGKSNPADHLSPRSIRELTEYGGCAPHGRVNGTEITSW